MASTVGSHSRSYGWVPRFSIDGGSKKSVLRLSCTDGFQGCVQGMGLNGGSHDWLPEDWILRSGPTVGSQGEVIWLGRRVRNVGAQ